VKVVVSALAALCLAIVSETAQATPSWLAPEVLQERDGTSCFVRPEVALDATGTSHALWAANQACGGLETGTIYAAIRAPAGTWRVQQLSGEVSVGHVSVPHLAVSASGRGFATWEDDGRVYAAIREPGGVWSAGAPVTAPTVAAHQPDVAVDAGGTAIMVWEQEEATTSGFDFAVMTSEYRNGAWSPPGQLSPPGESTGRAHVARNAAGDSAVVWSEAFGFDEWRARSRYRASGGSWTPAESISDTGGFSSVRPEGPLAVELDGAGNVVAAWNRNNGVEANERSKASGVWQTSRVRQLGIREAAPPELAVSPDGYAVLAWIREGDTPTEPALLVQASTRAPGGTWTPSRLISPALPQTDVYLGPDVTADVSVAIGPAGGALLAWTVRSTLEQTFTIQASHGSAASGEWQLGQQIAATGNETVTPAVAVDASGDAVAAWLSRSATAVSVQAAGFDGAGPRLANLAIPELAVAGTQQRFAAGFLDVWSGVAATPTWSFGDGSAAAGSSSSHTYLRPSAYPVAVAQGDGAGNTSVVQRTVRVVPPELTLTRSRITARWSHSRVRGRVYVALTGRLSGENGGRLRVSVQAPVAPFARRRSLPLVSATVAAHAFRSRVDLPVRGRPLPGRWRVDVSGTSGGAQISPVRRDLRVAGPKEGVVMRKRISTSRNGPNLLTAHRAKQLHAIFTFAPGDVPAGRLEAQWLRGKRQVAAFEVRPKRSDKHEAYSYYEFPQRFPNGRWTCRLVRHGTTVAAVSLKIG
jgi:hypothetical protein